MVNELTTVPDQNHQVRQTLEQAKAILDEMQNRCVQAFDPKSELPAAYPWPAYGLRGVTGTGVCADGIRFPHGFMKLMATAPCSKDGSFRLALAPGRYAVSIGITPWAPVYGLGPNAWWQYVDVAPHQWLQLVLPKGDDGAVCTTDADCLGPSQCLEIPSGQGSKGAGHRCSSPLPSRPPAYDSGMRGRIGAPRAQCNTEAPPPPPQDDQCIEAFREGSIDMTACAVCRFDDGEFVLPLAPGRYTLEIGQESRTVEVLPGQLERTLSTGREARSYSAFNLRPFVLTRSASLELVLFFRRTDLPQCKKQTPKPRLA